MAALASERTKNVVHSYIFLCYTKHMVFSFFAKDKQDDSLALLIDIGSASVGVALVRLEDGKPPHIISIVREDMPFKDALSSARFLSSMLHPLERALKGIQGKIKGKGVPTHIFCTLSSPWFILKNRHVRITREEAFQVTTETLGSFFEEDIVLLKEELKETLPIKDIAIIEKKILQIRLNGREIRNPYGKTTNRMELITMVSVSSARVIHSIERKVANFFHTTSLHFGAFPIAAWSAISDIFPWEQDFLFLDITGEATDVSLVNNGLMVETVSFPFGKNFFIREISSEHCTLHEEAATLFSMHLAGTLNDSKHKKVSYVVTRAKEEWLSRFGKSIDTLAEGRILPSKIFFTSDADTSQLLTLLMENAKSGTPTSGAFEVQYLDQFTLARFVTFDREVLRDPFIIVESLLAIKVINNHNTST